MNYKIRTSVNLSQHGDCIVTAQIEANPDYWELGESKWSVSRLVVTNQHGDDVADDLECWEVEIAESAIVAKHLDLREAARESAANEMRENAREYRHFAYA